MESPCSSETSIGLENWRENRQRLFIYWCFTHFIHGMIHSIRYSSQYLYFKDVMKVSNPDFLYGLSVSFIGATGVVVPLIISPMIDRYRNIKQTIFFVNVTCLLGNLLYSLPFSPAFPLIGQLLAGTTPVFGVIAMGEISRCYSPEKLTKRISALSLIYSIGTFTSIGLVFTFLYVDFNIGAWHINYANMPGIFLTIAFAFSTALAPYLVTDVSKEFDMKLEERIKRSSCGSTPNRNLSQSTTPDIKQGRKYSDSSEILDKSDIEQLKRHAIPEIIEPNGDTSDEDESKIKISRDVGEPFFFNINKPHLHADDFEDSQGKNFAFPGFKSDGYERLQQSDPELNQENKRENIEEAKKVLRSIKKLLRHRITALLMVVTFIEAFVYSIIVTSLPVLAAKFLNWGKVELALLSMVNKFLSVIISGSIYFLTDYLPDALLLVYGTFSSILALLTLSTIHLVDANNVATTVLLFAVAALSISGVPLIITSTRAMLAKVVPTEVQSLAEAVRMSVFEASFVPAGFLVPIVTMNVPVTALTLLLLTLCVLAYSIHRIKILVELKEEDEYWHENAQELFGNSMP